MATSNAPVQGPRIDVPLDPAMAQEPARKIGDLFADKAMIRPMIAAAVAIVAQVFRFTIDDALVDNITTLVTTLSVLYAAWSAQQDAAARARQQAEATREVVWSPASVADAVTDATRAGHAVIEPAVVPREKWGVTRIGEDAPTV